MNIEVAINVAVLFTIYDVISLTVLSTVFVPRIKIGFKLTDDTHTSFIVGINLKY